MDFQNPMLPLVITGLSKKKGDDILAASTNPKLLVWDMTR